MAESGQGITLGELRASVSVTARERIVLAALADAETEGRPVPSLAVLSEAVGLASPTGAQYHLDRLSHKRLTEGSRTERRLTADGWAMVGEVK